MSARRHVVIASRIFTPEGGAAAYRLAALRDALEADGADVTVLTSRPPGGGVPSTRRVRRWPVLRDRSGAVRGYVQYLSFDVPLLFRLWGPRRVDAIVVEPPPTTGVMVRIAARLRRVPYVYFAADVSSSAAKGIGVNPVVVRVLRRVESWVLRGAARVLAVSDGVAREVEELGVRPERIRVVGTGVDTTRFRFDPDAAAAVEPVLVYAGTMSEIQGAGVFVDAFLRIADEFPEARLRMLGSGTERDALMARAAASSAGSRIEFPGTVPGAAVAAELGRAAAGLASVRPGRGYDFAFATKTFVCGACGAPVIYAGVGPAGDRVAEARLGDRVGWDVDQVSDAMRRVLRAEPDPVERARIAGWVDAHHSSRAVSAAAVRAVREVSR
ncbi:glycosyltransferase family 4 protein [Agromyces tropicus]|uniref:D-inositol 3-phosphate glycosyltransferase n=1 Tax=Agromyces tropicus TaxID=555371 RepID=A0ABN2UNY8_9MICO